MIRLYDISDTIRGGICVWMIANFVLELWNFLHALRQKKKGNIVVSAVLLYISYIVIQVIVDITYWKNGKEGAGLSYNLAQVPVVLWLIFLLLLMVGSIGITLYFIRWKEEHITAMSVKESVDMLQAGLCYWKKGGQIILSNHKMDELCVAITGETLLNGEHFWGTIDSDCIVLSDGSIKNFKHREIDYYGDIIHELIATDVTEIYKKNEILVQEAEALRKMNESLRRYNQNIEETVHMQEILQAKMYIHDEMNRLMLLTSANADMEVKGEEFNSTMTIWRNNAILLGNNAVRRKSNSDISDINKLSRLLGIHLNWEGEPIRSLTDKNGEIIIVVVREALANAVKHAEATELTIDIQVMDAKAQITISNDGRLPEGKINEGGGLSNIRKMVEEAEGTCTYQWKEQFCIRIELPV